MSNTEKNTLVPKLRFAEFVGEWKLTKLSDFFSIFNGYAFSSSDASKTGCRWLKIADVGVDRIENSSISYLPQKLVALHTRFILNKGDFVVALTRPIIRNKLKIALVDEYAAGSLLNQRVGKLISEHNLRFVYSVLQRYEIVARIDARIAGTDPPNLSPNEINTLQTSIPTLPEQKKIAAFLTSVDDRIEQLKRKKTLLTSFKKGVMQRLFSNDECGMMNDECQHDETTQNPASGTIQHSSLSIHHSLRFRNEKGEPYPDWEEKTLGEVLKIGSGKDYKHLEKGSIPVYGSGGVMTYVDQQLYDGESVCIGRKGTIDKPRFLSGAFWTVDTLFYTHSFKGSLPKFIFFVFQQINWYKYNEASGVPSLSKGTIEKIKINIPTKDEQTKIANYLSNLDTKINQVTQQITQTQTFKKGLLQQMFV